MQYGRINSDTILLSEFVSNVNTGQIWMPCTKFTKYFWEIKYVNSGEISERIPNEVLPPNKARVINIVR